ncbi:MULTISPECIES: conditioned medium-induced protein 4 [Salinibaculum]|uniref:conditioned medium-induced protein 4 n=1 Tax=Salinibaculum TaxID=2732368 RepID=UPI0030CA85EE
MDEKTEHLRDIFMDVADDETVTESQSEQRGSLLRAGSVNERLEGTIGKMRERFDFDTELDDHALRVVVRRFYDGESDDGIATVLRIPVEAVFEARMDLHLVREDDAGDVDLSTVRRLLDDATTEGVAARLDVDPGTVSRAREVIAAENRAQRVSQRFRTEFEEILTDADIAVRLTADTREDGLDEATEGMEVDVDF